VLEGRDKVVLVEEVGQVDLGLRLEVEEVVGIAQSDLRYDKLATRLNCISDAIQDRVANIAQPAEAIITGEDQSRCPILL